jgi:uncharacterized protein
MTVARPFRPRAWLKNQHVQSILASTPLRRINAERRYPELRLQQVEVILDCGDGVRLQGWYSPQREPSQQRGTVVLLHGWEGSADSSYIMATGGRLWREGYAIFRLNLRDHGDTHHLNEELFHSCRLDEVLNAVRQIRQRFAAGNIALIGFSLGGNFALRIAACARTDATLGVGYVLSICPPVKPDASLHAIERSPWFYQYYFIRKWTDSLRRKQRYFPQTYDFSDWLKRPKLRGLTARLVKEFTQFAHLDDYLDGYSVADDRLRDVAVPGLIVCAVDDPVIPASDFRALKLPPQLRLIETAHGGHCGFIENLGLRSWVEDLATAELAEHYHG